MARAVSPHPSSLADTYTPPAAGQTLGGVYLAAWRFLKEFQRVRFARLGLGLTLLLLLTAALADLLAPYPYAVQNLRDRMQGPSPAHLLGTDDLGRDILSRVIHGSRISVTAAVVAVSIAMALGVPLGLLAGYRRGWVDNLIMRLMDSLLAFPPVVLALTVVSVLGPNLLNALLAVGIVYTPRFARLIRGQVLSVREREFVLAARCIGVSHQGLMWRHIFPNVTAPLIVQGSLSMAFAILAEATLSFLGLGVQPPTPSWGSMIRVGARHLDINPWMSIGPGLAIFITLVGFNVLGDALRDKLDPRLNPRARR